MSITLIRHAQSLFNATGQDMIDCPITTLGIQLKGHYDILFCSPLFRCIQTLTKSKIDCDLLFPEPLVREYIVDRCDLLEGEVFHQETPEQVKYGLQFLAKD